MRVLPTIACICVVAATGYYFVQEYRSWARQREIAQYQERKDRCDTHLESLIDRLPDAENENFLANCILQGYLSQTQLDDGLERQRAKRSASSN